MNFVFILILFYLNQTVGRWSQETGSDNEVHPHTTSSPNPLPLPLPHPDLTDTTYLSRQSTKMNVPPSILENIHGNYNVRSNSTQMVYDNDRYKYEIEHDNLYGQHKDYQANYSGNSIGIGGGGDPSYNLNSNYHQKPDLHYTTTGTAAVSGGIINDTEYPNNQIINQMMPHSNHFLYDKQRSPYMGSKTELPYMSKDRLSNNMYSPTPRESHYGMKSPGLYSGGESVHSVHSMLKNDYQVRFYFSELKFKNKKNTQNYNKIIKYFSKEPPIIIQIVCQKHPIKMDIIFHTLPKKII